MSGIAMALIGLAIILALAAITLALVRIANILERIECRIPVADELFMPSVPFVHPLQPPT